MASDLITTRVPFRIHQKVRAWAIEKGVSIADAYDTLVTSGLEHLELLAESERLPELEDDDTPPAFRKDP